MKDFQDLQPVGSIGTPLPNQTSPPQRILVVDDDANTRVLNMAVLTQAGYQVDGAANGAAGFAALQTGYYDLVITDNFMPKLTGIGMLKKLRAAQMSLPVIMATGALPTEEFARYPWLQPDATLLRPYPVEELLAKVAVVLRMADARKQSNL